MTFDGDPEHALHIENEALMDVMDSHFLSQQINMIHPHVNCDVIFSSVKA